MDYVYICKPGNNEELRYSIRSLVKNAPPGKIWLVGKKPDWYIGNFINVEQHTNKFKNTQNCLSIICSNKSISSNFVLMNDDFFVLKPIDNIEYYYSGTLSDKMESYSKRFGRNSYYIILSETNKKLKEMGIKSPLNYDVHIPMILNKKNLKKIVDVSLAPRSVYGNIYSVGGENVNDVKFHDKKVDIDSFETFVSTRQKSFTTLESYFKELFPEKTIYEE